MIKRAGSRPIYDYKNKEVSVQRMHETNFLVQSKFCPIDPRMINRVMEIPGEASVKIRMAFYKACRVLEKTTQRSILPKVITVTHARDNLVLPFSKIRRLLAIKLRINGKWQIIYKIDNIAEYLKDPQYPDPEKTFENISNSAESEYYQKQGAHISLKGPYKGDVMMSVIYETGYIYSDREKLPNCELNQLKRLTKQILYSECTVSDECGEIFEYRHAARGAR